MEHHHRGLQARILEIGVELREVLGHDHALVDDGARGQRRNVEHGVARLEKFLGAPPRHVEPPVERGLVDVEPGVDEQLLNVRQRPQGLLTASLRVDAQ